VLEMTRDNFCAVVSLRSIISDFQELYTNTEPTLYYDTTFCLGDFYVSCLLYRNNVFVGPPVMPLLMLIHERRTTESHPRASVSVVFVKLTGILQKAHLFVTGNNQLFVTGNNQSPKLHKQLCLKKRLLTAGITSWVMFRYGSSSAALLIAGYMCLTR